MKKLKKTGLVWLVIIILINVFILLSGRIYLYKLIGNTLMKGRMGPAINESLIFANREVKAGNYQPWPV